MGRKRGERSGRKGEKSRVGEARKRESERGGARRRGGRVAVEAGGKLSSRRASPYNGYWLKRSSEPEGGVEMKQREG